MNNLAHKIRLEPTIKQKTYFSKACGVARFTWNWSLAKWEEKYKEGAKTNALQLKKEFNSIKKNDFPFLGYMKLQSMLVNSHLFI